MEHSGSSYVTLQNLCQAEGWVWRSDYRQRTRLEEDGSLAYSRSQRVSAGVQPTELAVTHFLLLPAPLGKYKYSCTPSSPGAPSQAALSSPVAYDR